MEKGFGEGQKVNDQHNHHLDLDQKPTSTELSFLGLIKILVPKCSPYGGSVYVWWARSVHKLTWETQD